MCGVKTCLTPNNRASAYRGSWSASTLSFLRGQDGHWKMRFAKRNQTLGPLAPGTVGLTLTIDGRVFSGAAQGDLKPSGLVAD